MANTARVDQAALETLVLSPSTAFVNQAVVEFLVGLGVSCNNPPPGTVASAYTHTFTAGAGVPPYTFSISAGALPTGLSLNAATGVASGIPTVAGIFNFTVEVTDSLGQTATVNCTIQIFPANIRPSTGGGPYVIPKPCLCDITELAFEAIEEARIRRSAWPFEWSFPPPGAIRVTAQNAVLVPMAASTVEGFAYTVDQGFLFALDALIVIYLNSGLPGAWSPGDATWSLDLNAPVGVPTFQGSPVQGFTAVDVPLGSQQFPFYLEMPELFHPNDTIRTKFTNVGLPTTPGNYLQTILMGWRWPVI